MSIPARQLIDRQVRRARRRLFWQTLLHSLALTWALGLLIAGLWFLARPFALPDADETIRWAVPGTILGLATIGGIVLAILRMPNRVAAALELDARFGLKERVTTLLMLTPDQAESSAGQALLEDVNTHVNDLTVSSRFPLTVSWRTSLLPAGAFALAVATFFAEPFLGQLMHLTLPTADNPAQANAKEVEQQLENLRKVAKEQQTNAEIPKSEELKELEAEWDKLVNQPLDAKDPEQVRERVSELRKLEEKMKERADALKERTEKIDHLKKQLEQLAAMTDKRKEGPARDFEDALSKGDFKKAQEMLEKLAKDLKDNKLSKEQLKQLAEQFKEVQRDLKKLMDQQDRLKQAKQDFKDGKIDAEQLQRELEQFKELQQMAEICGECADGLSSMDAEKAGEKLAKASERFKQIELTEAELRELIADGELLDDALLMMANEDFEDDADADGNGLGSGKKPGRKRPITKDDPNSKIANERQKGNLDPRGQQRIAGYAKGGTFNKIPAKAVDGAFRQSAQDGPEAIDRQRIPDDAADIARGYFRKLGNQK